jgi:hypothetical protein
MVSSDTGKTLLAVIGMEESVGKPASLTFWYSDLQYFVARFAASGFQVPVRWSTASHCGHRDKTLFPHPIFLLTHSLVIAVHTNLPAAQWFSNQPTICKQLSKYVNSKNRYKKTVCWFWFSNWTSRSKSEPWVQYKIKIKLSLVIKLLKSTCS